MGTQTVAEQRPEQERRLGEALARALAFPLERARALLLAPEVAAERAAREAAMGTVSVDENGMTPGMKRDLLQPVRACLSEWRAARNDFDTEMQPRMPSIRAVHDAEREVEATERERLEALAGIERRLESSPAYIKKRDHKDSSHRLWRRYADAHSSRAPTLFARTLPYKAILLCIGVAEWFINYDTLLGFTGVPAIAAGSTVLLAVLLAFAADSHGELLKQWSYRFGESRPPIQRARDWRLLGLATVALLIVLGAAGAARYSAAMQVLATQLHHSLIASPGTDEASPLRDVLISMLANVAAWVVGIFLSYASHDEDPDYADATRQWEAAHRVWTRSRWRYEREQRHLEARFAKTINERRVAARTRAGSVENELNMLRQVQSHEDALLREIEQVMRSNIETCREALSHAALGAGGTVRLTSRATNAALSPSELNAMPLPSGEAIHTLLAA